MAKRRSAIETWNGGFLRAFVRIEGDRCEVPKRAGEFVLLRPGWALPASLLENGLEFEDSQVWLKGVPEFAGITLDFAIRDGRFQCVGVRSTDYGPAITSMLLRKLAPYVRDRTSRCLLWGIHRLVELDDGTIIAELPFRSRSELPAAHVEKSGSFDSDVPALINQTQPRRGKRPLTDDHLRRVAQLYQDAGDLPKAPYIASQFPYTSQATIRNWVRHARKRGFLGPAPGERKSGELPTKGDADG
jgi:hypothetical protein